MQQQKSRRYYIKTYGCQINVADSDGLSGVLAASFILISVIYQM